MTIGVLKYPGGHGDTELIHVLTQFFDKNVREVWYKEQSFSDINILFIGGGFPYIYNTSGKISFTESPALQYLPKFSNNGNTIVGFGNGFRLLCEVGLLPGILQINNNEKYICKQVFVKPENHTNLMTSGLKKESVFRLPIACNYGNYFAEESELMKMRRDGQILFRYCDYQGRFSESINTTGSIDNIAGVCNASKNVYGMMPQPERAVTEFWYNADGKIIFNSFFMELQNKYLSAT